MQTQKGPMAKSGFSVYDKETGVYDTPQFHANRVIIMRALMVHLSQEKNSQLAKFPESYALYYLGEFDEVTGNFKAVPTPQFVEEIFNLMPKEKINV